MDQTFGRFGSVSALFTNQHLAFSVEQAAGGRRFLTGAFLIKSRRRAGRRDAQRGHIVRVMQRTRRRVEKVLHP